MKSIIAILALIFYSFNLSAVEESLLDTQFNHNLVKWFEKNLPRTSLKSYDGNLNLSYRSYKSNTHHLKGALIFCLGKSEFSYKYAEVFYDMKDWGYDIFVLDHRGQGESERLLENPHKLFVQNFNDYIADFELFLERLELKRHYKKSILIAHSMGGAIALGALKKKTHLVDQLILSAPMIQINTKRWSQASALILAYALKSSGKETDIFPGFDRKLPNTITYKDINMTHSEKRFNSYINLLHTKPELKANLVTVNWAFEALKYTKELNEDSAFLEIPTLLLQAESDGIVENSAQIKFCSEKNKRFCHLETIKKAYHEIFFEEDAIRSQVFQKIKKLIL